MVSGGKACKRAKERYEEEIVMRARAGGTKGSETERKNRGINEW